MSKNIVVVFCATGRQGGGCVKYLLDNSDFHVKAVTRKPDSEAAKALAAKGAEVVQADLNDKASLVKAMQGAYGVFGVTDFWTANGAEETHGKNLVDAAKETGIKHFVFSTLEHSDLKISHLETKANVNDYLITSGIPRTSLYTAWFWENTMAPFASLKRDADGKLVLDCKAWGVATDGPIICISGEDCGVLAGIALQNPDKYIGKDIHAATEVSTPRKMAKVFEDIIGEPVKVTEVSMEEFEASKATAWPELWLNYKWFYLYWENRDVQGTLAMLPKVRTLKDCILAKGGKEALLSKENK